MISSIARAAVPIGGNLCSHMAVTRVTSPGARDPGLPGILQREHELTGSVVCLDVLGLVCGERAATKGLRALVELF